jgi:hypothetical protein
MTTQEMQELFTVQGFVNYMCVVRRKSDGVLGTLQFDHHPRAYYGFREHEEG